MDRDPIQKGPGSNRNDWVMNLIIILGWIMLLIITISHITGNNPQ